MKLFEKAINFVLLNEGGYVNNPNDLGGETKYGISKRSYPNLDIKHLTKDVAKEIYLRDWWNKYRYEELKYGLFAIRLFDLAINMGPNNAHRLAQKASNLFDTSNLIEEDGILGSKSITKINECSSYMIYYFLIKEAKKYYFSLNKPEFIRGWLNRLNEGIYL